MRAERRLQRGFTLRTLAGCALLFLLCELFIRWVEGLPDRTELGPRSSQLVLQPVQLAPSEPSPFKVAGAWEVTSEDPRLGGVSSLALAGDQFIALTDNGAVIRFGKPQGLRVPAFIRELPAGPRTPHFKFHRDSEALLRDPEGRGWWVSFENLGELWLYDDEFERALQRVKLGQRHIAINAGVEGAAVEGGQLLLFSELGGVVSRLSGSQRTIERITNYRNRISEAANLPTGEIILIERWVTPFGFRNALLVIEKVRGGYRIVRRLDLPARFLDNFEAVATERNGSRLRLWLMSDDSFEKPFRTLLVALDVEPGLLKASP